MAKEIKKTKIKKSSKKVLKVQKENNKKSEIDPKDPRIIFYTSLLKEKPKSDIALKFIKKYNIKI